MKLTGGCSIWESKNWEIVRWPYANCEMLFVAETSYDALKIKTRR